MDLEELKKDLSEIEELSERATRKRVKEVLKLAQKKIESDISNVEEKLRFQQAANSKPEPSAPVSAKSASENRVYIVDLTEYAWDQSDKFVKIFITLDGVQKLAEGEVKAVFTENSMTITARNLNNREYRLVINNLLCPINVEKSYHKVKTDMIAIYMKKQVEENWSHLTLTEKRLSEIKDSKYKVEDSDEARNDPSSGIMNMMKKMYDEGDSEMKRMIAKAWTENQQKQPPGALF